jgi:carboxyl-terminal processing protease
VTAYALRTAQSLTPKETEQAVTVLTTNILEKSQYAHHPLDDEMVGKFLDRYLDALDGSHMLFLQSDVEDFARFRPELAKAMHREGDDEPAHAIFQRYLLRLEQRADFITKALKKEQFDFTGQDRFHFDRKDAPRPVNLEAARDFWEQQLRYDYLQEKLAGKKPEEIVQTLTHRAQRVPQTMRKLSNDSILGLYLDALAHVYDPHSDYMDREQLESFQSAMNLSLAGIGASLHAEEGYCKIHELVPGGPAARGGTLKVGDTIMGVAQAKDAEFTDLVDLPLPQVVDLIRGPKGTTVRLSILPAGAASGAARKTVTIVRDNVKLEDQQAKARLVELPGANGETQRIGVIDLPGFYSSQGKGAQTSATADVSRLLDKLEQDKAEGVILDLRRNGGGSLEEAIDLTGLFVSSGPVVQTRDLAGRVEVGRIPSGSKTYDGPLIVLISRFSASASEIVAGALQDYGRAVIVGDSSTFGKGTVQTMIPLERVMEEDGFTPSGNPGALKVTISKFYRPSGQSTQLKGVKSDLVLPSPSDIPEIGESELQNPLPWDTIDAASFEPVNRVAPYLSSLKSLSAKRIAQDPDFTELEKEIDHARLLRADKTISLNEAEREKEKTDNDARAKVLELAGEARAAKAPASWEITLRNLGQPGLGEPVKPVDPAAKTPPIAMAGPVAGESDAPTPSDDLILRECEHVLADYIDLAQSEPAPRVTQR